MEHLKIAIADDNQKILDLLDRVIGMEKRHESGRKGEKW